MIASLQIETDGNGPDLVLLHGWGLNSSVWEPLREPLARRYRLHFIDMPGYGRNRGVATPASMQEQADLLVTATPAGAAWLGWSLGAQLSLMAAQREPAHIGRLILVAATPCFVARTGWPAAMALAVFSDFADGLQNDWQGTLNRFIGLLAADPLSDREMLRRLRERLSSHGEPSPAALARGLEWLRDSDLRPGLPTVHTPTLLIQGGRDRLVPPAAAEATASLLPVARVATIKGAGHAPFLSHAGEFLALLDSFLAEAA